MTDDNKSNLSRRKVLGSLGVISAGAAVGGMGTMALFTDEENTGPHQFEAGTLDLTVDWKATHRMDTKTVSANSSESVGFTFGDCKPGDSGYAELCFTVVSNPAYVWLKANVGVDSDNTNTEPEIGVDAQVSATGTSSSDGELGDEMTAKLVYDGSAVLDVDGNPISGSLNDVLAALSGGVRIEDVFNENEKCVRLKWKIPSSAGNVIQGDKFTFNLDAMAVQTRHTDPTTNPFEL